MKKLFTILFTLLSLTTFAQSWNGTGNTLQRRIASLDTSYRFNLGALGYMYTPTFPQVNTIKRGLNSRIDSLATNKLPLGLRNQIMVSKFENQNVYQTTDPVIYGNFIYDDAQLARAFANGQASQLEIFNSFKRFSFGQVGGGISNDLPADPSEMTSWSYDTATNEIKSIINSGTVIGFISGANAKFDSYTHALTLSSSILAGDNDYMGVVLAFMEDPNDMVANKAYGLTLPDGINTTDPFIPNQHAIIMMRGRNGANDYTVWYDYRRSTQKLIIDGTNLPGLFRTTANWAGQSVDIEIQRSGDSFTVKTSQFSDAPGGKGSLAFPLTIDLNSDPVLTKFKGKQSYGYASFSQGQASFSNIVFSGSTNQIYDLRNGNTYVYTSSGYVLDGTKNLFTDLGERFLWRNVFEGTFGYIRPDQTYDVIVSQAPLTATATLDFPSTTAQTSSTLTISVPNAVVGQVVTLGTPLSSVVANSSYDAYVSASDIVTVRLNNYSSASINPGSGIFTIKILR